MPVELVLLLLVAVVATVDAAVSALLVPWLVRRELARRGAPGVIAQRVIAEMQRRGSP